jgi:hypothetical protein
LNFNIYDGAILADLSHSPQYQVVQAQQHGWEVPHLPRLMLQQWSDVAYLAWERACKEANTDISNIRYFFRNQVVNRRTLEVIEQVLKRHGRSRDGIGGWPGVHFDMSTDDGKAILSTPNGAGQAWFLAQHKRQLGIKTISKVQIWVDSRSLSVGYNLLFYVEDVRNEV